MIYHRPQAQNVSANNKRNMYYKKIAASFYYLILRDHGSNEKTNLIFKFEFDNLIRLN